MFSTVLQELKGYFGREFLLTVFFPVLIFVSASLMLFLEVTHGLEAVIAMWNEAPLLTQALALLTMLVVVVTLAYLVYNLQFVVVRGFEGYWFRTRILNALRNARIDLYRRRWEHLNQRAQTAQARGALTEVNEIADEQLAFYPPPTHSDEIMPTQIGNILRASELYAYDHYGIDSTVIWTRLWPLLPSKAQAALENRNIALNFLLLMCFLVALFTLIWCTVLALFTNRWKLFLLCALGWPLAWVCYQSAVQSALAYGEQIKAAFDLYRGDLLKALNRPNPPNPKAERTEWMQLSFFFHKNLPISPVPPSANQTKGWDRVAEALANYLEITSEAVSERDKGINP